MIDTVKMICQITKQQYDLIYSKADIKAAWNNETGEKKYEITTAQLDGSYDSRLSVRPERSSVFGFDQSFSDYILIVEGSFNKILHGHNIYGSDKLHKISAKIVKIIENEYLIRLPDINEWYIYKIDMTYSFRIGNNNKDVLTYLNNLKAINYAQRKKVILYDTTIMAKSSSVLLKIYTKYNEFLFNDYKRFLKSKDKQYNIKGEELLKFSQNLLRLEASIKIRKLRDLYGKKYIQFKDIRTADLKKIWSDEFMKYFNTINFAEYKTVSNSKNVRERLHLYYKTRTANLLYAFWLECSQFGVNEIREQSNRQTFWRNYKRLKEVGVMIGTDLQINDSDPSWNLYHFNPFKEKAI